MAPTPMVEPGANIVAPSDTARPPSMPHPATSATAFPCCADGTYSTLDWAKLFAPPCSLLVTPSLTVSTTAPGAVALSTAAITYIKPSA